MRLRVYHVTALRAFHARPEDTDLTKYAVRDDKFFIVKSVLGFRPAKFGKGDSRKILEFKIEWDIDNSSTWEPWSRVRGLKEVQKWVQSAAWKNKVVKALFPVQKVQEEMESDEEYDREEQISTILTGPPSNMDNLEYIEFFYFWEKCLKFFLSIFIQTTMS